MQLGIGLIQALSGAGEHGLEVVVHVPNGEMFAPGLMSVSSAADIPQIWTELLPEACNGTNAVPLLQTITDPLVA